MNVFNVLILNGEVSTLTEQALTETLASIESDEGRLRLTTLRVRQSLARVHSLARKVNRSQYDVYLFIPPPDSSRQVESLLGLLRAEVLERMFLIVCEEFPKVVLQSLLDFGVSDFICIRAHGAELALRLQRLLRRRGSREYGVAEQMHRALALRQLIGETPCFVAEVRKIPLLGSIDESVLIAGETGTGKELFARAIHYQSSRASKPFVPVNCGAIPFELLENEFFGHRQGAYTGASAEHRGLIHEANGGTLFLDELEGLPPFAQIKLLRLLQEKEYRPLGSSQTLKADLRIIAAMNTDPERSVREGKLRQDLYYRLNVIPIKLPPLRDRHEDIILLSKHFLRRFSEEIARPAPPLSSGALQKLLSYDWPGNVRELENVIKRTLVLSQNSVMEEDDIVFAHQLTRCHESFQTLKNSVVAQFEKNYITELLAAHGGNVSRAARAAKKNRRSFWQLIRKHHIDVDPLRSTDA